MSECDAHQDTVGGGGGGVDAAEAQLGLYASVYARI
jgi:hypothetical protein